VLPGHRPADVVPLAKVHKEIIKGSMAGTAVVSPISAVAGTTSFHATGDLTILDCPLSRAAKATLCRKVTR
jgi:hypothetical protein